VQYAVFHNVTSVNYKQFELSGASSSFTHCHYQQGDMDVIQLAHTTFTLNTRQPPSQFQFSGKFLCRICLTFCVIIRWHPYFPADKSGKNFCFTNSITCEVFYKVTYPWVFLLGSWLPYFLVITQPCFWTVNLFSVLLDLFLTTFIFCFTTCW
jgi:hypothetical protein